MVYPKGEDTDEKDYLSVFYRLLSDFPSYTSLKLSILDESGIERYTANADTIFVEDSGWGWSDFISRADLFDKNSGLIKDNTLTLTGKFKFVKQSKFLLAKEKSKENAARDHLLNKRSLTDLEVKIQGETIRAHKLLVASSSSVLAKRLLKLEKDQHVLELEGLELDVAKKLFNFMYEGKVKNMEKYAEPLLEAADEFGIDRLKVYCGKYLFENLSVENAIEVLKLSEKWNAGELKDECVDFIQK
jgi:speckle-type POZ protein